MKQVTEQLTKLLPTYEAHLHQEIPQPQEQEYCESHAFEVESSTSYQPDILITHLLGPCSYLSNMDLGCCLSCSCCIVNALGNAVLGTQKLYRVLHSITVIYNFNTCFCVTSMYLLQSPKLVTL